MRDKECLDQLSIVNGLAIVTRLSTRVYTDEQYFKKMFERLLMEFDKNYKEFSSFEKWKKQVDRENYVWSATHTEQFWKANAA